MVEEIDVYSGRFDASKDEIANITDNFIKNRDFDGINFIDIQFEWDGNRRIYYGTFRTDTTVGVQTQRLGEIQVERASRFSSKPVNVRLVCAWRPLVGYWEELPQIYRSFFLEVEVNPRVHTPHSLKKPFVLQTGQPGRRSDKQYDEAYQKIQNGEEEGKVFEWYWKYALKLDKPDKYVRKAFKSAMKRRFNNS